MWSGGFWVQYSTARPDWKGEPWGSCAALPTGKAYGGKDFASPSRGGGSEAAGRVLPELSAQKEQEPFSRCGDSSPGRGAQEKRPPLTRGLSPSGDWGREQGAFGSLPPASHTLGHLPRQREACGGYSLPPLPGEVGPQTRKGSAPPLSTQREEDPLSLSPYSLRAANGHPYTMPPCLSLWERWICPQGQRRRGQLFFILWQKKGS